jgi:flotillin
VDAEAEAERIRIQAQAEAQAIFLKLDAEARGQFEILAKKAAALQTMVAACGGADQAYKLMMLEHLDTLAETSAKAISNIKMDKVVVWDGGNGATSSFLQSMARTLPPMMQVLNDIGGVDLPKYMGQLKQEPKTEVTVNPN